MLTISRTGLNLASLKEKTSNPTGRNPEPKKKKNMKTNETHKHNLVICSMNRGQYLANIIPTCNGDSDFLFVDDLKPALEFGACYSVKELRHLAESFGRDWEVQPAIPDPLDRFSAVDRAIGRRVEKSFGEWVAICEQHDAWHEQNNEPTLANVKAFLDDYNDWQCASEVATEPRETRVYKDWNNKDTAFTVGDRVLVHEDEGLLWEAKVLGFTSDGFLHLESEDAEGFERAQCCEVCQ